MVVTYVLVQILPALIIGILASLDSQHSILKWTVHGSLASFALGTVLLLLINHKRKFQTPIDQGPTHWGQVLIWSFLGLLFLLVGQALSFYIEVQFFNIQDDSANTLMLLEFIRQFPYFILASSLFAPIMEELVFRKAIFGTLSPLIGKVGGAVVSSLLFAFVHLDGHVLVYSVMGLIFCYLYDRTNSIWTAVGAHLLMNTFAVVSAFWQA